MLLEDISTYLVESSLVTSEDIVLGDVPPDPDRLVILTEYSPAAPEYTQDSRGIAYEHPSLQIRVRDTSYVSARNLIYSLYKLFPIENRMLGSDWYVHVLPMQNPFFLRRDENIRVEFVFNLRTMKRVSNVV